MAFESHAPNLANLQSYLKEEKSKQYDSDGATWWSIPKGMSSIRILPPWDPSGRIALAVDMHPIEYQGAGMKYKKYNWTCLNKTFDKPCKICEGLRALSAAGVDISKYEANRRQFYMNVIIMHDPRGNDKGGVAPGTHVIMRTPKTLYDWVISQITNPMVGDITSITNGIDIFITKEGEGLGTKYTPTLSPNGRAPIPSEYLDKIDALYNLDEIFGTGFKDETIDELVSHLKKSAGVIADNVPGIVNNMAGYGNPAPQAPMAPQPAMHQYVPQAPTNQYVPPMPTPTAPASPYGYTTTASSQPVAPSPYAGNVGGSEDLPFTPNVPSTPVSQTGEALPKCFGQYNPSQVNCVVCAHEVPCSQKSR